MGEAATVLDAPFGAGDLAVPDPMRFTAVMSSLSDDGRSEFIKEMMGALQAANQKKDLRPVQTVIDAWWHTFHFATHPKIEACIAVAAMAPSTSERRYTADEVRTFIGL